MFKGQPTCGAELGNPARATFIDSECLVKPLHDAILLILISNSSIGTCGKAPSKSSLSEEGDKGCACGKQEVWRLCLLLAQKAISESDARVSTSFKELSEVTHIMNKPSRTLKCAVSYCLIHKRTKMAILSYGHVLIVFKFWEVAILHTL